MRHVYPKHTIKRPNHYRHAKPKSVIWRLVISVLVCIGLVSAFEFMPTTNQANKPLQISLASQQQFMPISASEAAWIGSFLWWIKAPDNLNTVETMTGWIAHESPWDSNPPDGAMFTWNPINTTLPGYGSDSVVPKTPNVRIYPTENLGVQATASTFEEPQYATLLQNMRWSIGLCGQSYPALKVWSGNGYDKVC